MKNKLSNLGSLSLDKSFKNITTLRVGGKIKYFFEPFNIKCLVDAIKIIKEANLPIKIIGNGSNILSSDKEFDGVVIKLTNLNHYEINDEELYAEAGSNLITVANFAINNGLKGLEFAVGIPALLGGSIFMNAGAYNQKISDVISEVLVYKDNHLQWLAKDQLEFSYRQSIFQKNTHWIIIAATFKLIEADVDSLKKTSVMRNQKRWNSQPLKYPNCGSVFKNLDNLPAWKLIDQLGLRAHSIGGARFSEKHSNFIINFNDASALDVYKLIKLAQKKALEKEAKSLILEVEQFNW